MPAVCKEPTYHLRGHVAQWGLGSGILEIWRLVLELPMVRDGVFCLMQCRAVVLRHHHAKHMNER